jgi:hypothetical protein
MLHQAKIRVETPPFAKRVNSALVQVSSRVCEGPGVPTIMHVHASVSY